jgi:uncharacterized membrane protein
MSSTYPSSGNTLPVAVPAANALPAVRHIQMSDLSTCLRKGWGDFTALPSHAIILALIYPVIGLIVARLIHGYSVLPLLFPLAAGFALLGPFAAIGLYELSRRREAGQNPTASDALHVLSSPSLGAMIALGLLLMILFAAWVATAQAIYVACFGYMPAARIPDFIGMVLTTRAGWTLILVGCGVGLLFAIVALCISVVAFPLMLDRHASAAQAMTVSMKAVAENPQTMMAWGLIVAALLVLGSLPLFLGLAVVVPVLGHATWHLYRTVVEPATQPYREPTQPPREKRYAADFPVNLISWLR